MVLAAWTLAAVLLPVAPLSAQVEAGDIIVRPAPTLPQGAVHGYHEHVFQITNRSTSRAHQVSLELPHPPTSYGGLRQIRRTFVVPADTSIRATIYQPPLSVSGGGLRVRIDGRPHPTLVTLSTSHPQQTEVYSSAASGNVKAWSLLTSQRVDTTSMPTEDGLQLLRAEIPASTWSESWLAYSGYDGVLVTAQDLALMPVAVREALWRYVEAGGMLVAMGASEAPIPSEAALLGRRSLGDLTAFYAGFGVCLLGPAELDGWTATQLDQLKESGLRTRRPWDILRDPKKAHDQRPAIEHIFVPVRGLFLLVLVFAIVIGPVNVYFLTRRQKRIHLLWTVPAAALATTFAVFLYAWLSEGLLKIHRSTSLTFLDQEHHRAASWGHKGYYSTLTPGNGLLFDLETEVSAIVTARESYSSAQRMLDLSAGMRLESGWLEARVPAYFVTRRSTTRRERLRARLLDGAVEVTNGLGADITALHFADNAGQIYSGQGISTGAGGRLESVGQIAGGDADVLRDLDLVNIQAQAQALADEPWRFLQPGSYIAVLANDPFFELGLAGAEGEASALVYGLMGSDLGSDLGGAP